MSINLTWEELGEVDKITIYRSTSKMDVNDLPTKPLVVLEGAHSSFLDVEAKVNVVYYYVIVVEKFDSDEETKDGFRSVSYNLKLSKVPRNTGAGNSALIWGDTDRGYFGPIKPSNFITNQELCTALKAKAATRGVSTNLLPYAIPYGGGGTNGLTVGTVGNPADNKSIAPAFRWLDQNVNQVWHKFSHLGKVLYIPELPVGGRVRLTNVYLNYLAYISGSSNSYNNELIDFTSRQLNTINYIDLMKVGAVYGTGKRETSRLGAAYNNFAQDFEVTILEQRYRVRLMRCTSVDPVSNLVSSNDINNILNNRRNDTDGLLDNSEYYGLFLSLFANKEMPVNNVRRFDNLMHNKDVSGGRVEDSATRTTHRISYYASRDAARNNTYTTTNVPIDSRTNAPTAKIMFQELESGSYALYSKNDTRDMGRGVVSYPSQNDTGSVKITRQEFNSLSTLLPATSLNQFTYWWPVLELIQD